MTTAAPPSHSLSKPPSHSELETIDRQLAELVATVLPPSPYIRRIQEVQGRPLPRPSQQYYWWPGTPFQRNEQELQYLTFRPQAVGLLTSHGQWDDGNGGLAPLERLDGQASSERTPLHGSAFKKKITLADYKNREKSRSLGKDAAPSTGSPRVTPANSVTQEKPSGEINGNKADSNISQGSPLKHDTDARTQQEAISERKRDERPPKASNGTHDDNIDDRPTKRRRLSDGTRQTAGDGSDQTKSHASENGNQPIERSNPPNKAARHNAGGTSNHEDDRANVGGTQTLPNGGKSTGLPPMLSPTLPSVSLEGLPPLLSPTFPREIEDAYAEVHRQEKRERVKAQAAPASQGRTGLKDLTKSTSKAAATGTRGVAQPVSQKSMEKSNNETKGRPTKWFIIKIRKKDRKRISEFLKLPPNPNANYLRKPRVSGPRPETGNAMNEQPRLPAKRHMAEAASSSRDRLRPDQQSPETPRMPDSSPPAANTPSHKRQRTSNTATSAAMDRAASGTGLAATPSGHSRHATPNTPNKPDVHAAMSSEFERLVALGQKLKRESDLYFKKDKPNNTQVELGLVIATESVLTFMLAGAVRDETARRKGRAGNTTFWKGILPFMGHAIQRSHAFPRLSGLMLQLEGVICDTLSYYYQLTIRAQAQDPAKAADALSASEISENGVQAANAWRDGYSKLWTHQLEHAFPASWKKAERKTSHGKGRDPVTAGSYRMDFALPMSVSTTSIEAVNAGLCLLREYCDWQKVDWKGKLVL